METMHAAGRRSLPPVPRSGAEPADTALPAGRRSRSGLDVATERWVLGPFTGEQPTPRPRVRKGPVAGLDAAQRFVADLRAAAPDFAEAAGAVTAVVREAVPPARHRRARCRLVLRFADGTEADTTFLGRAGSPPSSPSRHGFDRQIRRWLAAQQPRAEAWLAADADAPGGVAIDLTAWVPGS